MRSHSRPTHESGFDVAQRANGADRGPSNPASVQRHPVTDLDQTKRVDAMVRNNLAMGMQAKLTIGKPDDKYEQEADQVAADVVQKINAPPLVEVKSGGTIQRQSTSEDEELQMKPIQRQSTSEDEELQRKPMVQLRAAKEGVANSDLESSINSARGGGQSLDAGLQRSMGDAMGADFSRVKIHTDSQSDQLNQSIQAKAFTTGQDVFFRQGAYDPGSRGGQELIAHELTHVVQQNSASSISRKSIGERKPSYGLKSSNLSQPIIQRFNVEKEISFRTATQAHMSGKGGTGVFFIKDKVGPSVVVKANNDNVRETFLASALHEEISGTATPFTRLALNGEKSGIIRVLSELVDWQKETDRQAVRAREFNDPIKTKDQVKTQEINMFHAQPNVFIMGLAKGKDFADLANESPTRTFELLKDKNYLKQLGKIYAVDTFLGNNDRIHAQGSNLGNWMTSDQGQISLIDNFDANGLTLTKFDKHVEEGIADKWELYDHLKPLQTSNQESTATSIVHSLKIDLIKSGNMEGEMVDYMLKPYTQFMTDHIKAGIAEGRNMLIKKLAPKLGHKRSRTLKSGMIGGDGDALWKGVKNRANALKKLK
jgi:hypothetical protein